MCVIILSCALKCVFNIDLSLYCGLEPVISDVIVQAGKGLGCLLLNLKYRNEMI